MGSGSSSVRLPAASAWKWPERRGARLTALKEENSRLLREDIARRSPVYRGLPEVVMLNHTDICNLRCVMCPRHDAPGTQRLARHALERVAESLFPTARKVGLAAAQAEPLATDFEFLVEAARRHEVYLDVVSNGTLLTLERYRAAREVLDLLDISIDCLVPEVYERIRVGARLAQVLANLQSVREERARVPDDVLLTLNAVVMRSTLPHLPDLVRAMPEFGADALVLKQLYHDIKATPEEDPFTAFGAREVHRVLEECARLAEEQGTNLVQANCGVRDDMLPVRDVILHPRRFPRGDPMHGAGLCWYLAQNFHVIPNGDVYPCIVPTQYVMGNVLSEDPVAIWNGPRFQALRRAHFEQARPETCSSCELAPYLR
jgi:radical SAM protein with 4Fe4S-binding SPASM domain